METFDFPFHESTTKYPESSVLVQFGNNYTFATEPDAPDMRTFTLNFPAMAYFLKIDADGEPVLDANGQEVIDRKINKQRNMAALEDFYSRHRLHKSFKYIHRIYGETKVRFSRPLEIPKLRKRGYGTVEPFEIEIVEVP